MKNIALLLWKIRENRYSVTQLAAALEHQLATNGVHVPVRMVEGSDNLVNSAIRLVDKGYHVIVGFSLLTTVLVERYNEIREAVGLLRKHGNVTLIAGGAHATGDPVGTLGLGFDFVFHGEAEETLYTFIGEILDKGDPLNTPGILYRQDESIHYTGRQPRVEIDLYPPFPYWNNVYSPLEITRGCIWGCRYCEVPYMHGAILKHRSIENVSYYAKLFWSSGRRDLRFISPSALSYQGDGRRVNLDAVCTLFERLSRHRDSYGGRIFYGTFPSEIRPEHAADHDAVKCLARWVANRNIIIGAQSGSNRILQAINRGHTIETVYEAVEVLNRYGFSVDIDFIYALPMETDDDLKATLEHSRRLAEKYKARIHAHYFLPLPGTPMENMEPREPPRWFIRGLNKLLGQGKLYGDWLKQRTLSWRIVDMVRKGIILGLRGWRRVRRRR
ncbi:MAG: TIGR04013 family B12-binding domain/radical SAM domain-containing protein [Desulfurococcales archaeon]|nr:TIGR04013 family B12-binding domain/radical SAM domain-containing protein [Desulfurococcales archaeon]